MNSLVMITCLLESARGVAVKEMTSATPAGAAPVADTIDYPRYAFNYAVHDPTTNDNKAQWEVRDGDAVKGSYSLTEHDGSLRVVDYAANDVTGFNAIVKRLGPSAHPTRLAKAPSPLIHIPEPFHYGFGAPIVSAPLPVTIPAMGKWSLPWDPSTHSYGGWVPINAPLLPLTGSYATIYGKKIADKRLIKLIVGPVSLHEQTLIIKKKH